MTASFAVIASPASATVPVPVIASISAGRDHTCALTTTGGVKCWGSNDHGQLGDGSTIDSAVPVEVSGLTSGIAAISAGSAQTCALTTLGGLKCWGDNFSGQLGIGSTVDSNVPVDVPGLTSGVKAISAGQNYTCALTTSGGAKCWGFNFYGELGNGHINKDGCQCVMSPVDVSGLTSGIAAISAGGDVACVLTTSGGAKCWGYNFHGALGNGVISNGGCACFTHPVDVSGLTSGVTAISAGGDHACALTIATGVKCWGFGSYGQIGDGAATAANSTPVDVSGLTSGVDAISAGVLHTCALTAAGGIKCWGDNSFGQLGDVTHIQRDVPVDVSGLTSGVTAISAGGDHTCALSASGTLKCWGENRAGELGVGTTTDASRPVRVFRPTISDVLSSLSVGRPISAGGQVPVTTTWAGADPYGAITSYRAQMQIEDAGWSEVILSSPTATSLTVLLTPGPRYNFRIRATDPRGDSSVWSPGVAFRLNPAQETSAIYAGTWVARTLAGSWGGTVERSTELNASASFTFTGSHLGRTFTWIGTKGPAYGSADVYVDGVYATTIDCYASSTMKRRMLFRSALLDAHRHTVMIVNRGSVGHPRIDIDGFLLFHSAIA